jgi:hypothetical protein
MIYLSFYINKKMRWYLIKIAYLEKSISKNYKENILNL